jgi:hypothetical protein
MGAHVSVEQAFPQYVAALKKKPHQWKAPLQAFVQYVPLAASRAPSLKGLDKKITSILLNLVVTEPEDEDRVLLLDAVQRFLRQRSFYKALAAVTADAFLHPLESENISIVVKALDVLADVVVCGVPYATDARGRVVNRDKELAVNYENERDAKNWLFRHDLYEILFRVFKRFIALDDYPPVIWRLLRILAFDCVSRVQTTSFAGVQRIVELAFAQVRSANALERYFVLRLIRGATVAM